MRPPTEILGALCVSVVLSAGSSADAFAQTATETPSIAAPSPVSKVKAPQPSMYGRSGRPTVGWIEKVSLSPGRLVLNAKLDTGADYSSLHAHDIQEFDRAGQKWVKFQVMDRVGKDFSLEARVVRTSLIKRMGGKHQRRNVIRLGLCLGAIYMKSDVNLVDRSDFKLQMLVGRNFLAGSVAIDPAISFTVEPQCLEVSDRGENPVPQ